MSEDKIFKSYLHISKKRFTLCVFQSENSKKICEEIFVCKDNSNQILLKQLSNFLSNNIYNIEKKIGSFIKEMSVIYESEDFFQINLSIKNNNYGNQINRSSLYRSLQIAKEECLKTIEKNNIVHMLIDKYIIDNNEYPFLPKDLKCEYFSLDLTFICISEEIIKKVEILMKEFHISVDQIISANYLESFFTESDKDLDVWAFKISNGFNENEVRFNEKKRENQGFFERFFNFFR